MYCTRAAFFTFPIVVTITRTNRAWYHNTLQGSRPTLRLYTSRYYVGIFILKIIIYVYTVKRTVVILFVGAAFKNEWWISSKASSSLYYCVWLRLQLPTLRFDNPILSYHPTFVCTRDTSLSYKDEMTSEHSARILSSPQTSVSVVHRRSYPGLVTSHVDTI